ncbi:hypothetical protein CONLIGDRAFT_671358 [Coniochaeta ligniaria NRRL 30616]|uniref:Transcription factor domain-containing protein n=1 Tax=Coniochaeta ligniaria NRRL 30616 TaxID=1408157 RepID=A0A1J7J2Q8_9PEZI|nr:hypothetical protein CONLIGDRAFT_671358 [Coniochaeta ligniaria NRRL 30616]
MQHAPPLHASTAARPERDVEPVGSQEYAPGTTISFPPIHLLGPGVAVLIVSGRCLVLKRDCVIRTKSRPRRRVRTSQTVSSDDDAEVKIQTPGHLGTFSINYTVPARQEQTDPVGALRDLHNHVLSSIPHGEYPEKVFEKTLESFSVSNSSAVSHRSDINPDTWRQPLFDVASAEALLNRFRSTVSYLPFVKLCEEDTVSHLNATKPFVLLAILTVASGAISIQKHALYEEEFQTALGLKHVAGGESSLELLQGVLIYCAWHPFQLRPKHGRLVHCFRVASDIVDDLKLHEKLNLGVHGLMGRELDDYLDMTRAYLAYVYLISTPNKNFTLSWAVVWRGKEDLPIAHASGASTAAAILEPNAQDDGDYTLVALVRISSLFSSTTEIIKEPNLQVAADCQSVLATLQQNLSSFYQSTGSAGVEAVRMQAMFVDIYLDCGGLLNFPVSKTYSSTIAFGSYPSLPKLYGAVEKMKSFLDYVADLEGSSILSFTINDWTRLIAILTLAFRLSFPPQLCPEFSSRHARSVLRLDKFLDRISQSAKATSTESDLLSASRSVLGLAKARYDTRLAALEDAQSGRSFSRTFGCPMMPGKLDESEGQSPLMSSGGDGKNRTPFFDDTWATMAMGWSREDEIV